MEEGAILVSISTREAWNEYFYTLHSLAFALAFALSWFTRLKYKRRRKCWRKEMENVSFLASASVFAFAVALMLLTRVFTCSCVCVFVARVNQPYAWVAWLYTCALWWQHDVVGSVSTLLLSFFRCWIASSKCDLWARTQRRQLVCTTNHLCVSVTDNRTRKPRLFAHIGLDILHCCLTWHKEVRGLGRT